MNTAPTRSFWDRFWNNPKGQLTISETPNIPLIVWLSGAVGMNIFRHGIAHTFLDTVAYGALFTWALMEIFQGDSYLRRVLGVFALVVVLHSKLK